MKTHLSHLSRVGPFTLFCSLQVCSPLSHRGQICPPVVGSLVEYHTAASVPTISYCFTLGSDVGIQIPHLLTLQH